jgi:hypothetical protein
MAQLPTGTVTFLFTDIEGSTQLLQRLGPAYAQALGEHQTLLRAAFAEHGGVEVDTQGDAFFVAFASAPEAVAAARLLGAAATLRETIGVPQPVYWRRDTEEAVAPARAALEEEQWAVAFAAGQVLSLEEAIAEALGDSGQG